jgi:hypothetical protein
MPKIRTDDDVNLSSTTLLPPSMTMNWPVMYDAPAEHR